MTALTPALATSALTVRPLAHESKSEQAVTKVPRAARVVARGTGPTSGYRPAVFSRRLGVPLGLPVMTPVVALEMSHERIVLTACHPLYSAAQRYVVSARLTEIETFAVSGEGEWPVL